MKPDIMHHRAMGESRETTCGLGVFDNEENRKHNFSANIASVTCPDCLKLIISNQGLNLEDDYKVGEVGDVSEGEHKYDHVPGVKCSICGD